MNSRLRCKTTNRKNATVQKIVETGPAISIGHTFRMKIAKKLKIIVPQFRECAVVVKVNK